MTTPRALHLLRHGAPVGAGTLIGHGDAPPTEAGIARCVAQAQTLGPVAIVCSDLMRAAAPARAIAAAHGCVPRVDPRWRELDFGAWDGLDPAHLPEGALARFHADPEANPPPGGECWSDLCRRVGDALAAIDDDTLVVSHAGAIRAALALLLRLDYAQTWGVALPYGARVSLHIWPGEPATCQITGLAA